MSKESYSQKIQALQKQIVYYRNYISLKERSLMLGELVSGIIHDINNAINCISMNIELAQEKLKNQESPKEDLDITLDVIEHTLKMIKRLQNFSNSSNNNTWENIHLDQILQDSILIARLRGQNTVQIKLALNKMPAMLGNKTELQEVFVNILNNAMDSISKNKGIIDVKCHYQNLFYNVSIKDNGSGMSMDTQKQIFKRFFTTKKEYGTGLGLDITRSIIRRHDGSIKVNSQLTEGTEFCVNFLNYADKSIDTRKVNKDIRSILLVSEDIISLDIWAERVSSLKCHIMFAKDMDTTLSKLDENNVELIIIDLDLCYEHNGFELARKIRSISLDVIIAIVTEGYIGYTRSELLKRGVDFVINKPFSVQNIQCSIKDLP